MELFGVVVSDEMRAAAIRADECISDSWAKLSKRSMEIGWEGNFLKRNSLWPVLGYASELEYRLAKGIGRSTWFVMVGLAEKFPRLTKEQFLSMTIENAKILSTEDGDTRYDQTLLEKAATMTARAFKNEVVHEGAKRNNQTVHQRYTSLSWRVSEDQREVIERALTDWQLEHHLDDPARALELLLVEYTNRATFVGFLQETIVRLQPIVSEAKSVVELQGLQETVAALLQDMNEMLRLCPVEHGGMVA